MPSCSYRRFARFLVVLCLLTLAGERRARADDIAGKLYDDAKTILEDLIRKEAVAGIVQYLLHIDPQLADLVSTENADHNCDDPELTNLYDNPKYQRVNDAQDIAAFYFHDAIERLHSGQFGSFGSEVRTGLLDLLTDSVFALVRRSQQDVDTDANLKALGRDAITAPSRASFNLQEIVSSLPSALGTRTHAFAWKLYLHLECGLPLPSTQRAVEESCAPGMTASDPRDRAACYIARAIRAELSDAPSEMEFYLQKLAATVFANSIASAAPDARAAAADAESLFLRWAENPKDFEQVFSGLTSASLPPVALAAVGRCPATRTASDDLSDVEQRCVAWKSDDAQNGEVTVGLSSCPLTTVPKFLDAWSKQGALSEAALRAAVTAAVESDKGKAQRPPACNPAAPDADFVVMAKHFPIRAENSLNPQILDTITKLKAYRDSGESLRQRAINAGILPEKTNSLDPLQVEFVLRAKNMLDFLAVAHSYVANTGGSTHATSEPLSVLTQQALQSACGDLRTGACSLTTVLQQLFGDPEFADLVRYGARGDFRSLATSTLESVLQRWNWQDTGLCSVGDKCRKFIIAFAGYAIDAETSGNDTAARAEFENAAEEVLTESPDERRLFPRKGQASLWWQTLLVPNASLRVSWSPDYFTGSGQNEPRYVASIDWLTVLRWAPLANLGFQTSLVDLAAPLAELSFRPNARVDNGGVVALDLVRPRLDVLLAVPEFSRRLVLETGAALKTYSVDYTAPSGDDFRPTLSYHGMFSTGYHLSGEFNVGAKFIF